MKKLTLTIAIVLGMTVGAMAQGGLFERGYVSDEVYYGANNDNNSYFFSLLRGTNPDIPDLPDHGQDTDQNATPLGGGIALLLGMGAAYAAAKRRKE